MSNTTTYPIREDAFTSLGSAIGHGTHLGAAHIRKQAGISLRKIVAILLFATTGLLSIGATFNLAFARMRKVRRPVHAAHRAVSAGQFRLLNIYKSLMAAHPGAIAAMNAARTGIASWYGGIFQGRKTAMGTVYDMNDMTAAHRTLPLGTWVQVTNLENDRQVVVQVTDRGPYVANRIMDLSYAAAQKLGYAGQGTTKISMKVLGSDPNSAEIADNSANGAPVPAMFESVSTHSTNVNLSGSESASDPVSAVIAAVSDLVTTGSPLQAATDLFV